MFSNQKFYSMGLSLYDLKIKVQNDILLPWMRKHPKLADLYYFLFSSDFSREHQKVMNGKYLHLNALKRGEPNAFHLRREIHRLEKGLVMRNRRAVFAADYINDVVANYLILLNAKNDRDIDDELLRWAHSVLTKYFTTVDTTNPKVAMAKKAFEEQAVEQTTKLNGSVTSHPYLKDQAARSKISYEEFFQLCMQRRSVRWFQDKPVPHDLIEKAMVAATQSPSACNRQPFRFKFFDHQELKNQVGSIPMGIKGIYENVPVFAVLIGRLSAYLSERDRHVIYIDGGLASMSFMFALETLGLSSFPINWPDIESLEVKMENLLDLDEDERPMMLIGMGYADEKGGIPFSQKKSPQQLITFN